MPSSAAVGTCSQHMRIASGQVDQRCRLSNFGILGMLPLRIRHRSMDFSADSLCNYRRILLFFVSIAGHKGCGITTRCLRWLIYWG